MLLLLGRIRENVSFIYWGMQGSPFLKIITCPTARILKYFDLLIWNKEENLSKSTCLTGSFTCPGPLRGGKRRALGLWREKGGGGVLLSTRALLIGLYNTTVRKFISGITSPHPDAFCKPNVKITSPHINFTCPQWLSPVFGRRAGVNVVDWYNINSLWFTENMQHDKSWSLVHAF